MSPRLWIPGPTHVRPEVAAELVRAPIGHRGRAMAELIERIDPPLRLAFGLEPESRARVAVHTSSATGIMEAALHGVGPRVLCVANGAFSERWAEIARILGKRVEVLAVEWGAAVEPDALERALAERGPFDALTLVANESSTGVRTPLGGIARVLERHPATALLVDVVTLLGGAAVDLDRNRIDLALAGSQKALALPPGIAVLCASERYLESARSRPRPSFYLDPVRILDGHAERATPSTPAIPLYYALARQLEDITQGRTLPERDRGKSGSQAWQARFAKHERMLARTRAWATSHGLAHLPEERHLSPTVSCIRAGGIDAAALISGLKERGHEIGSGYGKLKGATFRIGHLGDHTEDDLARLLEAADEVVASMRSAG